MFTTFVRDRKLPITCVWFKTISKRVRSIAFSLTTSTIYSMEDYTVALIIFAIVALLGFFGGVGLVYLVWKDAHDPDGASAQLADAIRMEHVQARQARRMHRRASHNSQSDHQPTSDQNLSGSSSHHASASPAIQLTPSTPPPGHVRFSLPHILESQESEDELEEDEMPLLEDME